MGEIFVRSVGVKQRIAVASSSICKVDEACTARGWQLQRIVSMGHKAICPQVSARKQKLKRGRKWRGLRRNWGCRERLAAGHSRAERGLVVDGAVVAAGCRPRS